MQLIHIEGFRNFLDLADDRELICNDSLGFKVMVFYAKEHKPPQWLSGNMAIKELKKEVFNNCQKVTYSKKEAKVYVETEDFTYGFDEAKLKSVVVKQHSDILENFKSKF